MNQTKLTPQQDAFLKELETALWREIQMAFAAGRDGGMVDRDLQSMIAVALIDQALAAMLQMNLTIAEIVAMFKARAAIALKTELAIEQARKETKQ